MTLKQRLDRLEKRNTQHIELQDDPYGFAQMDTVTQAQVLKNLLICFPHGTCEQKARIDALLAIANAEDFLTAVDAEYEFLHNLITAEDGER